MKGFCSDYPGIYIPKNKTLTIKGGGSLDTSSNGWGAGIGGGYYIDCGDIHIEGGNITASGGRETAGIGSGSDSTCGDITISGGSVTATGGLYAAGIGSGDSGKYGSITIGEGITSVIAKTLDCQGDQVPIGNGAFIAQTPPV